MFCSSPHRFCWGPTSGTKGYQQVCFQVAVDSFLAHKGCTGSKESFNVKIHKLADEHIKFERTTRFQMTTTAFGAFSATKRRSDHIVQIPLQHCKMTSYITIRYSKLHNKISFGKILCWLVWNMPAWHWFNMLMQPCYANICSDTSKKPKSKTRKTLY